MELTGHMEEENEMVEMKTLEREDVRRCLLEIPSQIREAMDESVFLAGGFIRSVISGEPVNDLDFHTNSTQSRLASDLAKIYKTQMQSTQNAHTILAVGMPDIQVIRRWVFSSLEDCIRSFDYTIAQAGIVKTKTGWRGVCCDRFYRDVAAKRLIYTAPDREEDAGGSLLRALKFAKRGYHISPEDLSKVIARALRGLRLEGRSEAEVSRLISPVLREVDPLVRIGTDLVDEHTQFKICEDAGRG